MPIHYRLVENGSGPDARRFLAQVQISSTANLDVIASRMTAQGAGLPKAEVLTLLESMIRTVEGLLLEGQRVNLGGLADLAPRIVGAFHDPEELFDPERHQLDVSANAGSRVRIAVRSRGHARRAISNRPSPCLTEFVDSGSATAHVVTLEAEGTLQGNHLKFDPSRHDEGIFFLPTEGGTPVKVAAVLENKTRKLVFKIPDLPSGTYQMEVRTRLANSSELRTGRLSDPVTA